MSASTRSPSPYDLTLVSLFSGAGGLDVGFEQTGFRCAFANELDADAAATWVAARPDAADAMHAGSIEMFSDSLSALRGRADVVIGGPPCQGFSVAGKMDPRDPRSKLVWMYLDAVRLMRPRAFVMENVAALGRLAKWSGVREEILRRAREMGYSVAYRVWNAADFGVPQNRERVLFVGSLKRDASGFEKAMLERVDVPPRLRDVLLGCGEYGSADNPDTCPARITLAKRPVIRSSPYAGMLVNGAGRPLDLDGVAPTLPASMGGNRTPIVDQAALEDVGCENWFASYHHAITGGAGGLCEVEVPERCRRLTLREAAAIQTFPSDYPFRGPVSKRYKQVGNAVPCLLARACAEAVADSLL